ncbi:zona pellucida-binding protein 1 [Discoglossus pictus]
MESGPIFNTHRPVRHLLLTALLAVLLKVGCFTTVESDVKISTAADSSTAKVIGFNNDIVNVYIKLNHNSPRILCITRELEDTELQEPSFEWHGPSTEQIKGTNNVMMSKSGSLLIRHFKENMSGLYTCGLHYVTGGEEKNVVIKYLLYAYNDPDFINEFSVRYHAARCDSPYNKSFAEKLIEILRKMVHKFTCEVIMDKYECHDIELERVGIQSELFFLFKAFTLDSPEELVCSSVCDTMDRMNKAKKAITSFFDEQGKNIASSNTTLPEIYIIGGTYKIEWIDQCNPGYGIDPSKHSSCLNCCVICSPGTYNPSDGSRCLPCKSSSTFGAQTC